MQYGTPGTWPGAGVGHDYQVNFALTDQAQHPTTIHILPHNDFLWRAAIATRTGTFTCNININGLQFQTVYSQAGIILPTAGVNDTNFWGTVSNPFPLFSPLPLRANDVLTFTVQDTSGANNTIALYLIGTHFDAGSLQAPFSGLSNSQGAS